MAPKALSWKELAKSSGPQALGGGREEEGQPEGWEGPQGCPPTSREQGGGSDVWPQNAGCDKVVETGAERCMGVVVHAKA